MLAGVCAKGNRATARIGRMLAVAAALAIGAGLSLAAPATAETAAIPSELNVSSTPGGVAPGGAMAVSAEVVAASALPSAILRVHVSSAPLATERDIDAWLAGESAAGDEIASARMTGVRAGNRYVSSLVATAPSAAGVWGLELGWSANGQNQRTRSVVTVLVAQTPTDVFALWPLTVPTGSTGLLSAAALSELTAPEGELSRQLDALIGRTVSVGIDPRIIGSIEALGSGAPQSAQDWLTRLRTVSLDSFPLQFGDADPSAQAQAGLEQLLEPGPLPSSGANQAQTPVTFSQSNLVWPALGTVVESDLKVFARSGYPLSVLSSSNVTPAAAWVRVAGASGVVADPDISASFSRAVAANSQIQADAALAETVARLSFRSGQSVVIAPDRVIPERSERLSSALETIGNGVSRLLPLSTLVAREPVAASFQSTPIAPARIASVQAMLQTETAVAAFSRVALEPKSVTNAHRRELLAAIALGWLAPGNDWLSGANAFNNATSALLSAVGVSSSSTINILASEASVPITVENALAEPVAVEVRVSPSNGRLVVAQAVSVELEANSRATVRVPVEARIGNGAVQLRVSLVASDGTVIGSPTVIQANVQADWEGWGAAVLGLFAAGLFAVGLVRQIRRSRATSGQVRDE